MHRKRPFFQFSDVCGQAAGLPNDKSTVQLGPKTKTKSRKALERYKKAFHVQPSVQNVFCEQHQPVPSIRSTTFAKHTLRSPSVMSSSKPLECGTLPGIALRLDLDASKVQNVTGDYIPALLRKLYPDLKLTPHVSRLLDQKTVDALTKLETSTIEVDPGYEKVNFETWYQIRWDHVYDTDLGLSEDLEIHPLFVSMIHRLRGHTSIRNVHFLQEGPPPVDAAQNPMFGYQTYMGDAPLGINVGSAWAYTGGDGSSINIIDIEQGWNLNHEDLAAAQIDLISGMNFRYFSHGTNALGPMLMVDNTIGGVGIAPRAKGRVVSLWQDGSYNPAAAISAAIIASSQGDFILIQTQEYSPVMGTYHWPVEIADATFQLLRLALAKGVTVIQPAGNGKLDLDDYMDLEGKQIFNRSSADFRESGAIMVGSGSADVPHKRMPHSNYGSRIDVFSWGEDVFTTHTNFDGTANDQYVHDFNGTSAAASIIAGIAMTIQGAWYLRRQKMLEPLRIRYIMQRDGTPSENPSTDMIGVMPNLDALFPTTQLVAALPPAPQQPMTSTSQQDAVLSSADPVIWIDNVTVIP